MNKQYTRDGVQFEVSFDLLNGEAQIWRSEFDAGMSLVDTIDLWDLLQGYSNNAQARVELALEQNISTYKTAKHKWYEEED